MTKTNLEFGILVIVVCLIFEFCDLEFLFRQYSSARKQLAIFTGKAMQRLPGPSKIPLRGEGPGFRCCINTA
jgi:hypothetical protein